MGRQYNCLLKQQRYFVSLYTFNVQYCTRSEVEYCLECPGFGSCFVSFFPFAPVFCPIKGSITGTIRQTTCCTIKSSSL